MKISIKYIGIITLLVLINMIFIFPTLAYSKIEKLPDGRIAMSVDDLLKLNKTITTLKEEKAKLEKLVNLLEQKVDLLEKKNKTLETTLTKYKELSEKEKSLLEQQLDNLTDKINKQLEIINYKDIEIAMKNEQLKSQRVKTVILTLAGITVGIFVDQFLIK